MGPKQAAWTGRAGTFHEKAHAIRWVEPPCSPRRALVAMRGGFWTGGAVAQAPRQNTPQAVAVEVAPVVKKIVPVRIEALGSVTPIASVAVKPRVDTEITEVHFRDGAMVKKGDLLFTLDSRAIEAQAKQIEGLLAGARANLEEAERDVTRYTELVAKNATTM